MESVVEALEAVLDPTELERLERITRHSGYDEKLRGAAGWVETNRWGPARPAPIQLFSGIHTVPEDLYTWLVSERIRQIGERHAREDEAEIQRWQGMSETDRLIERGRLRDLSEAEQNRRAATRGRFGRIFPVQENDVLRFQRFQSAERDNRF